MIPVQPADVRQEQRSRPDIIAIGAPVGGGASLAELLSHFSWEMEASIFVVLHAAEESPMLLADILNAPGRMRAAEAGDGEAVVRRRVYVAADGKHMLIRDGKVHLSSNGAEYPRRPSIDALFSSAAEAYRERVIGVLLLHAREDGAHGLRAIRRAGGRTVTHRNREMREELRHPETGEPLADEHLELEEIARRILGFVNGLAD